jgi:hypothetical protein
VSGTDKNNELQALMNLLDEPNEDNYGSIRDKITSYGLEAIPLLEEAWLNSMNDDKVKRIEDLIDEIRFNDLYFELANWAKFYANDLLRAFMLLTTFRYPDLDEEKYLQKIEKLKQDVWLEMNENLTALEKVKVMNHIFYDIHKFRGQLPHQTTLSAYFLNDLLDTNKGSAISLGILYITLARELSIPIFGVDLYKHFILAYMDDTTPPKEPENYRQEDVLFYIASVNKGSIFTRNEINRYIEQTKIESKPEYFLPCNNKHIIHRLIEEMITAYNKEGKQDKADLLAHLLKALD